MLLRKLGWAGGGLGVHGEGLAEPVATTMMTQRGTGGLGAVELLERWMADFESAGGNMAVLRQAAATLNLSITAALTLSQSSSFTGRGPN